MLTKEQKMKMVSDAIDAGFKIELKTFNASVEQTDKLLPIFEGLPVLIHDLEDGAGVVSINDSTWHDAEDDFEASIFLE